MLSPHRHANHAYNKTPRMGTGRFVIIQQTYYYDDYVKTVSG
jgi:hypothetical protein